MKKSIIALFAAATMVAGVNAQDGEGGAGAGGAGAVSGGLIATGVVAAGIIAGVANNNSADAPGNGGVLNIQQLRCATHRAAARNGQYDFQVIPFHWLSSSLCINAHFYSDFC